MAQQIEEIPYDEGKEKPSTFQNLILGIQEKYWFALLALFLIAFYLVQNNYLTKDQVFLYIGIAIAVILLMSYRGFKTDSYLTYKEALALSEQFVKDMQRLRKIPFGEIKVTLLGRLRKFGNKPDEYTVNVRIISYEGMIRDFEAIVDPIKNGLGVIGLLDTKTGYDALRMPERKMVPTGAMYEDYQARRYAQEGRFAK